MSHRNNLARAVLAGIATHAWVLPVAAAAEGGDALEEIVVTAEKQTQSLQKTAAAVTAIPAAELLSMGVEDLREAQKLVPSVRFQAEGNNTQVLIRGVGSVLDQANVEPNVSFNVAGIYVPREETSAAFFDLEQFEVLPGPQGTLYGRSAIGGTINLTPTRPGFNNEGSTLFEVGNYAAVHATVTQNFRATDAIAFRAAVDYNRRDGVMETGADSRNDVGVRLSALANFDDLTVYLWWQGAGKYGRTANLVNKGTDPATGAYCEGCFYYGNPWNDTRTGPYAGAFGEPVAERNHYTSMLFGGQIDYHFSWATLTYLPSYLYLDTAPLYWLSAIQAENTAHYNQVTQELRLSSNADGKLRWLGGLYYYNIRNFGSLSLFTNQPFRFAQDNVDWGRLTGYAAFGQVTYSLIDNLRVTGGARGSTTKRDARGSEPAALGGAAYTFDKTFDNVDWKVGLEADVAPKVMAYANIQTGYQPGTFNELPNTATFNNEVKPSRLLAYTAGVKSRWFDDRLQINNEIYYYNYRDLLIQSYNIAAAYNLIFNARKVVIKGDQLNIVGRVTPNDQFNVDIGYSHARNADFITPAGDNFNGYQLAYAPDLTAAAGYTHSFPVGDAFLRAHLDWRYESSWWGDYVHNKGTRQAPSNKGDGSLTYDAGRWTAGAWIKNIQNKVVIAATAAAGIPGPATSYLDVPRTYGLRFTVNY